MQAILAALSTSPTKVTSQSNLAQCLSYLTTHARRSSVIFIVSDFFTPPFERELQVLCRNHDVVLVQLEIPFASVANSGLVTFADAESGQRILLDTSSRRVQEGWDAALVTKRTQLKQLARSCGADHITISDSATRPLIQLMRERALQQPR
jgi:hypothetical protein